MSSMYGEFKQSTWLSFLEPAAQELVKLAVELYEREERLQSSYTDYSFIVFPMAKAYEGFLKQFLLEMGLLSQQTYEQRHFRIGRSLNPDISSRHKDEEWLYDDVARLCSPKIARDLWNAWIESRNHVFHYFPHSHYNVPKDRAYMLLSRLAEVMEQAMQCSLQNSFQRKKKRSILSL